MYNKQYVNHSPNMNLYKGQIRVTPPKAITNRTNRSSVSGSTNSHYNSVNSRFIDPLPSVSSYLGSRPRLPIEPSFLDRGRLTPTSNTPNQSMINTSVHLSGQKVESKPSTPTYKLQQQSKLVLVSTASLRHQSPLNLNKTTPIGGSSLSSMSIKQRILRTQEPENELPACINHPQKKSKYRMPHDQSMSLCSKCAVTMVGQGFKVEEIHEDHGKNVRRSEIDTFLTDVNKSVPIAQSILYTLSSKKDEVRRYYDQQRAKMNGFFSQMEDVMHRHKSQIEKRLSDSYNTAINQYESYFSDLKNTLMQTQNMQRDIQLNVERIIEKIELQPFREIMTSYRLNLDAFLQKQQEVQRNQVEILRVTVPDVESRLFSLLNEIDIAIIKTTMVKRNNDLPQKPSENSFYVSFESRDQFNAKQLFIRNIYRFKQHTQQTYPDENVDTSNYINPNIRVATVQLYEKSKPRQTLQTQPNLDDHEPPFQKQESFEEGHSQMIEKDDIENNYNLILCDNESEQEEISSHLNAMERRDGPPLFCSPQFKDH